MAQTGLANGLGYPTKGEIRLLLAKEGNDLGKAMVALKKRWRAEVTERESTSSPLPPPP